MGLLASLRCLTSKSAEDQTHAPLMIMSATVEPINNEIVYSGIFASAEIHNAVIIMIRSSRVDALLPRALVLCPFPTTEVILEDKNAHILSTRYRLFRSLSVLGTGYFARAVSCGWIAPLTESHLICRLKGDDPSTFHPEPHAPEHAST